MKLVEILARELSTWPEGDRGNDGITQDDTGELNTLDSDCDPSFHHGDQAWEGSSHSFLGKTVEVADDYDTAVVGIAQWQAERDRQKGGEWKRHRGGFMPKSLNGSDLVECKRRDGELCAISRADQITWAHSHCRAVPYRQIMSYRVISQPQAEEVEYRGPFPCARPEEVNSTISYDIEYLAGVFNMEAKTDQIDGPIKWRDRIVELEAHEEDIQREIASLHARLTSEGFQLIRQYPSVSADVPVSLSYAEWVDGDIVRCVARDLSCADLTIGKEYTVVTRHGETGVIDDEEDHMSSCIEVGELEFVRRP